MSRAQYWDLYARAFASSLSNDLLSECVKEPNVTGAYVESWIRAVARSIVGHRFRVSTGTVVRPNWKSPQCDLIIWDPSELPAFFERGDFALVPIRSVRAIIEIKRHGGARNRSALATQLRDRQNLLPTISDMDFILGVFASDSDSTPWFNSEQKANDQWLSEYWSSHAEPPVTRILYKNKPDAPGIMAFIYFLTQVLARQRTGASRGVASKAASDWIDND